MVKAILLAASILSLGLALPTKAQQKRIYIAPDDHTDYFWAGTDVQYADYFPRALDQYLDQMDATAASPPDQQARWNADGSIWIWTYERSRSSAQLDRLIGRIRDGHLNMPLTTMVSVHGGSPLEVVLRDMYYAGRLERRFGLKFPLAVAMENSTLSLGLGSVYAGSGALYSWKGICAEAGQGYCSNVPGAGTRPHDAYWWTGPDGSRILTKWMSYEAKLPSAIDPHNQGPGGYAEARYAAEAVPFVDTDATFRSRWPYDVIGLFGAGWDDLEYIIPLSDSRNFVNVAAATTTPSRRVIVSNEIDFFQDFAAAYGASLPSQSVSYGNEWDVCVAQFAAKSARVKRAVEQLRAAEAMASIAALADASFTQGRETARDEAFHSMALFFEHNVCGGGPGATTAQRVAFQEQQAGIIEAYTGKLYADATARLAQLIPAVAGTSRVFAYNPLGWSRTDVAEAAAPGTDPLYVVDVATGAQVPAELIGSGAARTVRWLASGLPSLGYKVFELRAGTGGTSYPATATYSNATLASPAYKLTLNGRGAITGLIDLVNGARQVRGSTGYLNDWGSGTGKVTLERNGPVSATIRADITSPIPRTVRVTLYHDLPRIDIVNTLAANWDDVRTFAFGLNIKSPLVRHEEVGAVLRAKLAPAGDYSATDAVYQWLTMGHFADMSAADNSYGVTISNADAYFMKLGNSTLTKFDTTGAKISVLAGGRAASGAVQIGDVHNQGGDTSFRYAFALQPHTAYAQAGAMRMSLEHQNPLVTAAVAGPTGAVLPPASWSLVSVTDPSQFIWSVKPAEEGIGAGLIVRVWNQSTTPTTFAATLGAPYSAATITRATHIETNLPDQTAATTVAGNQIATYRLQVAK